MSIADDGWSIDDHLQRGDDASVALWRRIDDFLQSLGDVTHSVSRSTVTYKGPRRGFAGAHPKGSVVVGYFDLMRELPADPRVRRASPYGRNLYVHHFQVADDTDIDATFLGWLREAYAVGCGAHLTR